MGMPEITVIRPPAVEPITLAEAKENLRVDHNAHDARITRLIKAAREMCEKALDRALIRQECEMRFDRFPSAEIALPRPIILAITAIEYATPAGVLTELPPESYVLNTSKLPGFVLPAAGYSWPETMDTADAVRIRFLAGYGTGPADVPERLVEWMHVQIATMYRYPEAFVMGQIMAVPNDYHDQLIDGERWWYL